MIQIKSPLKGTPIKEIAALFATTNGAASNNNQQTDNSTSRPEIISPAEAIKQAFRRGEWLSNAKAIHEYRCYRFSQLLGELERIGWVFFREWQYGTNATTGKTTKWMRYKLLKEPGGYGN